MLFGLTSPTTNLLPALTIACVKIVQVVVPSPASVAAFSEASLISIAPKFFSLSLKRIDLATDTPSLVT